MFLAACLGSCAPLPPAGQGGEPLLRTPVSPDSLGYSLSLSQVVTSDYDGDSRSYRIEAEVTPDRLVIVGLSHLGVPFFTLELEAGDLAMTSLSADYLPFDPRHILSDFQLAYWPTEVLARNLAPGGFRLENRREDSERFVYGPAEHRLVAIDYAPSGEPEGVLIIQHFDLHYRLRIRTIGRKEKS